MTHEFPRLPPIRLALFCLLLATLLAGQGPGTAVASHECAAWHDTNVNFLIDYSNSMGFDDGWRAELAEDFALGVLDGLDNVNHLERAGGIGFPGKWSFNVSAANIGNVRFAISNTTSNGSGTPLYDAIVAGAQHLGNLAAPGKKIMVVITDGEDEGSTSTFNQAAGQIAGSGATTYLVFTGLDSDPGAGALQSLANSSGANSIVAGSGTAASTLVDQVLDAACRNFRPHAEMNISDTELRLGHEGFAITFDGTPSSDAETSASNLSFNWTFTRPDGTTFNRSGISVSLNFTDNQLPNGENWTVRLRVTDGDGASDTRTRGFRVVGSPPDIDITGPTSIDVLDTIDLEVTPDADIDGGVLQIVWDIVDSPPGAQEGPQNGFGSGPLLPLINTLEQDIGTWVFSATATDDEGDTDSQQVNVEVNNLPPKIHLVGPEVDAGDLLTVETTILDDEDGGLLTFDWDIIQAPQAGSIPVQEQFLGGTGAGGAILDIATSIDDAGTWIFRLTATDNDDAPNSVISDTISVVVDGLPEAHIRCPTCTDPDGIGSGTIGSLSFPLELDGADSVDPDSPPPPPCPGPEDDHCHDTLEPPVRDISDGVAYTWSLVDVPSELWGLQPLGRVDEVFGIPAFDPTMALDFSDLEPGDWTFELKVRDGEDNEDVTSFTVSVVDEHGPPVAILNAPARYTTDLSGLLNEDITLNGGLSLDPDNVLDLLAGEELQPGAGITDYAWAVVDTPQDCVAVPVLPAGPTEHTVDLFTADSILDPECFGFWSIELTVTDDDTPPKTDRATTSVIIGNCPEPLCIDYPTQFDPQFVEFSEDTDIAIYYHLDSVLYDEPVFNSGMFAVLEIFHESDLSVPVYSATDPNVLASDQTDPNELASDQGGWLLFHWNGYSNSFERPESGQYTLAITLYTSEEDPTLGFVLAPTAFTATEPEAIWIEAVEPEILPSSDRYISRDDLQVGGDQIDIDYEISGVVLPDELCWRVSSEAGVFLIAKCVADPAASGTIAWDGLVAGSTIDAGNYTIELEAVRGTASLGSSEPHSFTIFEVELVNPRDVNGDGDINDPEEGSGGIGTEFSFWDPANRFHGSNTQDAGQLRIDCEVTIVPVDLAPHLRWRVFDGVDTVDATGTLFAPAGTDRRWNGIDRDDGIGRMPRFTIEGMPATNDDFGRKTVRVQLLNPDDSSQVLYETSQGIEVFWPLLVDLGGARNDGNFAKNHPDPDLNSTAAGDHAGQVPRDGHRAPNWMSYWGQVVESQHGIPRDHLRYMDTLVSGTWGATPSVYYFDDGYTGRHDRLLIGEIAQHTDADPDGPGPRQATTGIDTFRDTVIHENHHAIDQSVDFTNQAFGFGISGADLVTDNHWSFNLAPPLVLPVPPLGPGRINNHFRDFNADMDFADAPDNNADGDTDDLLENENMDRDGDDVPNWVDLAPGALGPGNDVGNFALNAEDDVEHALAGMDWGNPGKRHKTDDNHLD